MENNITLDELILDINKSSTNEYVFIRVLNKPDRALFLAKLSDKYYNKIFITKKIHLNIWINIMCSIKLSEDYIIYRKAYVGENKGKKLITQQLTNFVIPLWTIEAHNKNKTLFQSISDLFINRSIKHILLNNDKMEIFNFKTSKYILSSWQNIDYKMNYLDILI